MAKSRKPTQSQKKKTEGTHWCALDVRPMEVRERAMQFMSNGDAVLEGLINVLLSKGSISLKEGENNTFLGYVFQEIEHSGFSTIGIRSESSDPYKMVGALMFKYNVMLKDYEIPDHDDDLDDFR